MSIIDLAGFNSTPAGDQGLSPQDEALDEDFLGDDINDIGYSPLDYRPAELAWGFTAREARTNEPLTARLAREVPESEEDLEWDGLGDATDTDGELLDDEVGDIRAGRLAFSEPDNPAAEADFWATDLGIDGGAASAEEAAVHIVTAQDA